MSKFEYRVVPAPVKGKRARGVRGAEGRFAHALEELMNEMAGDGWEYWRSETLPSEERSGLTSTTTTYRNVMIFRRQKMSDTAPFQPELLSPPAEEAILLPPATGLRDTGDNGVEETADDDGFAELLRRRAARLMGAPAASADTVEAVVKDTEAAQIAETAEDAEGFDEDYADDFADSDEDDFLEDSDVAAYEDDDETYADDADDRADLTDSASEPRSAPPRPVLGVIAAARGEASGQTDDAPSDIAAPEDVTEIPEALRFRDTGSDPDTAPGDREDSRAPARRKAGG